jgi:hypothetical protein
MFMFLAADSTRDRSSDLTNLSVRGMATTPWLLTELM